MDVGNLVVDLSSLVIVVSVLGIVVVQRTSNATDDDRLLSDDPADRGYYGPNPSEDDEATQGF